MINNSWRWTVEIEQLGGRSYVRIIENGEVRIRGFDRGPDAESYAEGERLRLNLTNVVRR